jgi:adenosyl cobinamide kinase/adenosyl cobinamide phosphate guanylyltransferase
MSLTLVLGGVRSGKSAYAERLAREPVLYVATLRAEDEASRRRIALHRARRPSHWPTLEAVSTIAEQVQRIRPLPATVLLDGFGLVVAAALEQPDAEDQIAAEVQAIIAASEQCDWIVVSEEVGLAPLAATEVGRRFQDLLGEANQALAGAARRAILVVAGRALVLP